MSWGNDSDNQTQVNIGIENQWKLGLSKVDNCLKNIKGQYEDLKARFDFLKQRQLDMSEIEKKRQNINSLIGEMSDLIAQLDRMVPNSHNVSTIAMKNQVKELRRRAADVTKLVTQLCAAINSELYNRQLTRKKELSIINNELGFNENDNKGQIQMTALEDAQIRTALEEQKQSEKIARDMITLESIFVRLSTMIHEQGEVVDRIEANVEDAYVNTDAGEKQLGQAVIYKRSAMKKKICLIGIGIAALAVVALIIGLSVGLNK